MEKFATQSISFSFSGGELNATDLTSATEAGIVYDGHPGAAQPNANTLTNEALPLIKYGEINLDSSAINGLAL